jgi:Ca2+/Na+ antiporter
MNSKQKTVLLVCLLLIILLFVIWGVTGAEVFTKTKVWIDKTTDLDKMLGVQSGEWQDKFIFGLLPGALSLAIELLAVTSIGGVILLISVILFFYLRTRK